MISLASWSHQKLSQDIEHAQKRCLKLLYPALAYNQSLNKYSLKRLNSGHDVITQQEAINTTNQTGRQQFFVATVSLKSGILSFF